MSYLNRAFIVVLVMMISTVTLAQDSQYLEYVSQDKAFSFKYPESWYLFERSNEIVLSNRDLNSVDLNEEYIELHIQLPIPITNFSLMGMGSTPSEIAKTFSKSLVYNEIVSYMIKDYPATSIVSKFSVGDKTVSSKTIILTLDQNTLSIITAVTNEDIDKYKEDIDKISQSIEYLPPIDNQVNSEYIRYENTVDIPVSGKVIFEYPNNWFVSGIGILYIQNVVQIETQGSPQPNEIQIALVGPDINKLIFSQLSPNSSDLTPQSMIGAQVGSLDDTVVIYGPQITQLNNRKVVSFSVVKDVNEITYIATSINGYVFSLVVFTKKGEINIFYNDIIHIIETIDYIPITESN